MLRKMNPTSFGICESAAPNEMNFSSSPLFCKKPFQEMDGVTEEELGQDAEDEV